MKYTKNYGILNESYAVNENDLLLTSKEVKHKGASCKYKKSSRYAISPCYKMQRKRTRIKVLRDLQSENDPILSGSKPTILKKRKSNPLLSLDTYYDPVEAINK
ncbi:20435_t:CDS:2, partial [Gigaspora rosea]